jgi:hypothetical protein
VTRFTGVTNVITSVTIGIGLTSIPDVLLGLGEKALAAFLLATISLVVHFFGRRFLVRYLGDS